MRYTVLGATGFIGRHLVSALCAQGHDVFAPTKGSPQVFDRPLGHVLYCIGLTADFRTRPHDTMRAHICVLADVLEKADFDSLLYLSSTRVYGRDIGSENARLGVDVSDPSDLYNLSKLAGESLCRSCGRDHVRVARLSNVVGHDPESDNFLSSLVRDALAGKIVLRSHPDSAKDYILIDDVVRLLQSIADRGAAWIYNVASGANLRHREIAERLAALTGCTIAIEDDAPLVAFPPLDVTRIRTEFGFTPTPVLEALPGVVDAFR
jgi:nucleoside-diphosphate-sugar epimerase